MENQITSNTSALRLFFTDDVFLVKDTDASLKPKLLTEDAETPVKAPVIENHSEKENVVTPVPYPANTDDLTIAEEPKQLPVFKFLGGNKKSVLIIVHDQQNEVSSEQGRALLRNIVKAIDLNTPDFALINYANYTGTDFIQLYQFFKPSLMLAFGVGTADLKLEVNWQNEILLHGTTRMIFAPNLHHLDGDLNAKKLLWSNLKQV